MRNSAMDVLNYDCQGISSFEGSAIDASSFTRFAVHQRTPALLPLPGSFGSFQTIDDYPVHPPYCWSWETPTALPSHTCGYF
jgi:hypothetical protein